MNSLELDALQLSMSNDARALYAIYLAPKANNATNQAKGSVLLSYKDIMQFLNSKEEAFTLGRQVNSVLKELDNVGLIRIGEDQSFKRSLNKQVIHLPLSVSKEITDIATDKHQAFVKMNVSWRPDADLFEQICQLVGVIDKGYSADELGEYIAYWLGYPEKQFTDYQWTQKFVLNIKQRRQRQPVNKEQTKIGHQWITPQAGLEIDDNVKQLVEKYSGKS
ncbi:DnaT-like ssDNA-binding domain-containing protein [Glaciecola sp. MF2-115]|uniref:DnaT-like ssDNA-binding domain-containing protein n=1 Tax=Glaciecola sp. MF2-115 TaxID=3384827 RepID=UPI0039A1E1DD